MFFTHVAGSVLPRRRIGLEPDRVAGAEVRALSRRAQVHLDGFLQRSQSLYSAERTFGTTDDMKYVYQASQLLPVVRAQKGCEEAAPTIPELAMLGRAYARRRIESAFFQTGEKDKLQQDVAAQPARKPTPARWRAPAGR